MARTLAVKHAACVQAEMFTEERLGAVVHGSLAVVAAFLREDQVPSYQPVCDEEPQDAGNLPPHTAPLIQPHQPHYRCPDIWICQGPQAYMLALHHPDSIRIALLSFVQMT